MNMPSFKQGRFLNTASLALLSLSFIIVIAKWSPELAVLPDSAYGFMLSFLILAIVANILMFKELTLGFLLSSFFMLIASRISGMYGVDYVSIPISSAFAVMVIYFWFLVYGNLKNKNPLNYKLSLFEWQLIFVRLYLGFDLIPHFTEKLFSGSGPYLEDVHSFMALGLPQPDFLVYLAGCCELAASIAIALGFFTRLGAICTTVYLLVATLLGKHFLLGFIWARPGGGWEYPLLWSALTLSFAIAGANKFSVDYLLNQRFKLPKSIKWLMGNPA